MKRPQLVPLILLIGCGGSSPTAPSAPTAPQFPNVLGTWAIAYSAVVAGGGTPPVTARCPGTMSITAQTGGGFSGTLNITSPCGDAVSVSGQIDTTGIVSTFALSNSINGGLPSGCSSVSSTGYTGRLVGNAMTVNSRSVYRCLGTDLTADRTITATH